MHSSESSPAIHEHAKEELDWEIDFPAPLWRASRWCVFHTSRIALYVFFYFKCAFNHFSSSPVNNSVHQNQTPNTRAVRICGLQTCEGFTRGIELVCTHRCWPATACQTHCLCQNSFAGINGDPFVPCDCIVEENRLDISLSLQDFWVIYLGSCYCDRIRLMLMRFFWYKTSPAERILFLLLH